jgi:hypothetical protein
MNTVRNAEQHMTEAAMNPLGYVILLIFGSIAIGARLVSCILWAALSALGFDPLQEE